MCIVPFVDEIKVEIKNSLKISRIHVRKLLLIRYRIKMFLKP